MVAGITAKAVMVMHGVDPIVCVRVSNAWQTIVSYMYRVENSVVSVGAFLCNAGTWYLKMHRLLSIGNG